MFVFVSVSIDIGRDISGTLMCVVVVVVVIQPNSSCCMPCFWRKNGGQLGLMLEDMFFVPNLPDSCTKHVSKIRVYYRYDLIGFRYRYDWKNEKDRLVQHDEAILVSTGIIVDIYIYIYIDIYIPVNRI